MKPFSPRQRTKPRFVRDESGSSTVEFVLVFPLIMSLFLAAFELGMLQVRHTLLERGLDLSVRSLRISTAGPPDYQAIKDAICENSLLQADCDADLKLEMVRMRPNDSFAGLEEADCIDREQEVNPVREWTQGDENDLMLLRACLLFDPFFPSSGIGYQLSGGNTSKYALTALTAFVAEPE